MFMWNDDNQHMDGTGMVYIYNIVTIKKKQPNHASKFIPYHHPHGIRIHGFFRPPTCHALRSFGTCLAWSTCHPLVALYQLSSNHCATWGAEQICWTSFAPSILLMMVRSEIRRKAAHVKLRLVVEIYHYKPPGFSTIQTVVVWDFWTINSTLIIWNLFEVSSCLKHPPFWCYLPL